MPECLASAKKQQDQPKEVKPAAPKLKQQVKLSYKEERELESLEPAIMAAEEEIAALEQRFSEPDFFAKFGSEMKSLQEELNAKKSELERLYSRWEELEAKKESLKK